jgi:hypothetical protein
MKVLVSMVLVFSFTLTASAFDETVSTETTTEMCKLKGKHKRAKRRSQRRHGIHHSSCMKTKTIRVRN